MNNSQLLSIIIPVHNGEKLIKKTVMGILNQSYSNIEVILVENWSKDRSYEICSILAANDPRIKVYKSFDKGTSFARKVGVEKANGTYIIFVDQDDHFINRKSLECIAKIVVNDNSDICQFAYFKEYIFGIRRKITQNTKHQILSADEVRSLEIKGIFGVHDSIFSTNVWSKIYKTEVLKESVKHINKSVYFAEDEYFNILAFSSPYLRKVSYSPEAFYCWKTNIGFSAKKNSGETLLDDYEIVKPLMIQAVQKFNTNADVLWDINIESIYCFRAVIMQMIKNANPSEMVISKISKYSNYKYIIEAKKYFQNYPNQQRIWDDLKYLVSDYSAEGFYNYCKNNLPKTSTFNKIKMLLKG